MLLSQLTELALVLLLLLVVLELEVLLLCLYYDMELCLLTLDLLNQFLQVCNLLEVLDLLGCNLLVEGMLLLLASDLCFKVYLC